MKKKEKLTNMIINNFHIKLYKNKLVIKEFRNFILSHTPQIRGERKNLKDKLKWNDLISSPSILFYFSVHSSLSILIFRIQIIEYLFHLFHHLHFILCLQFKHISLFNLCGKGDEYNLYTIKLCEIQLERFIYFLPS